MTLLRLGMRVTFLAMKAGIGALRGYYYGPHILTRRPGVESPLVVQLLRVADEHLLTQNYLRSLLAEWTLMVMVLRRVEARLDLEGRLILHVTLAN